MKRFLILLTVISLVFSASACTSKTDKLSVAVNEPTQQQTKEKEREETPKPQTNYNYQKENDILETESNPTDSKKKTIDEIIEVYNSKIRSDSPNSSQADINSLLVSYDRKESVPQYNIVSYEYSTPNNIIGIVLFEDIDTKEITFGSIEINKNVLNSQNENNVLNSQNENNVLQGFMQMCYYLTYALDSTSEDEFMEIWRTMRNNEDNIAVYTNATYQIQDYDDYLSFAIKYSN